jgi:hypothetical protein
VGPKIRNTPTTVTIIYMDGSTEKVESGTLDEIISIDIDGVQIYPTPDTEAREYLAAGS